MDGEDQGRQPLGRRIMDATSSFVSRLGRTKVIDASVMDTNLRRCLSTADITLLGIGHMVGSGVYVLSATVAKNMAGPAIILAFLFSGFASFLAALCYAELGVRYPKSGSAYSYTYLALGELWAFLVGWNVALENVIGVAAVARSCSAYVDSLSGGILKNATSISVGNMNSGFFAEEFDFLALIIVILFVVFLSFGVRATSYLNNVFSGVNMVVIVVIIGVGGYFSNFDNWTNPATGGFMPYGWSGVLSASASCFYAYIGFDAVATSGEEAKDPQKSIPRATMVSMGIASSAYIGVSSVLTLMVNYKDIKNDAGLPEALADHGATWAKIIVIVGAVCGMATALIGSLFALTRVVYAMADDGLLFKLFSMVNKTTKVPLGAMYAFATLSALMALILDIQTLVEVMSIGTLFAYMVVSASVIILRYRPTQKVVGFSQELSSIGNMNNGEKSPELMEDYSGQLRERFYAVGTFLRCAPEKLVPYCVLSMTVFLFLFCFFIKLTFSSLVEGYWWCVIITIFLSLAIVASFSVIVMHEQSSDLLRYRVPLVPLIPALSIGINVLLITSLQRATWIRLIVWVTIGLCLYFLYGLRHSKLNEQPMTSKSSLLNSATTPATTWGSLEKEMPDASVDKTSEQEKFAKKVQSSSSQEILVLSMDKSP